MSAKRARQALTLAARRGKIRFVTSNTTHPEASWSMPIYEYACDECGCHFDVRQSYKDAPVSECKDEKCGGKVHKVFSPPAIIFKGSGFYVTDNAKGGGRRTAETESAAPCEASGSKPACKGCEKAAT